MNQSTRFTTPHKLVVVACCTVILGARPAIGQNLHSEFVTATGSSLRAGLLYPAGLPMYTPTRAYGPPNDPWIAFDKVEHVAFGFLLTLGSQYILVNKLSAGEHEALPASAGIAASVGLTKELRDLHYGSGFFSTRDLIADAAGIALAVGLILL